MWRMFQRKKDGVPMLTETQQRLLCDMMYHAFVEIRRIGYQGKARQAAHLASAFHNLPLLMNFPSFDWSVMQSQLERYQQEYPREKRGNYDYVFVLGLAKKAA